MLAHIMVPPVRALPALSRRGSTSTSFTCDFMMWYTVKLQRKHYSLLENLHWPHQLTIAGSSPVKEAHVGARMKPGSTA